CGSSSEASICAIDAQASSGVARNGHPQPPSNEVPSQRAACRVHARYLKYFCNTRDKVALEDTKYSRTPRVSRVQAQTYHACRQRFATQSPVLPARSSCCVAQVSLEC
ncbi:unnamed protein product, partial [Scytosiphon promiscuus]